MPLSVLSALLHLYIGWRLVPALEPSWAAWAMTAVLAASALLVPMSRGARRHRQSRVGDRLAGVGLWFMGLLSSLFVLTLLRDGVLFGGWLVLAIRPDAFALAQLSAATGAAVPLLAMAMSVIGLVNARRTAAVVAIDVPIAGLPDALHGFTIAQISDVHVGPTIKQRYLEAIVTAVNRLGADMVAVTGDLVDGPVHRLAAHVAPLARLQSRHGTFFVTGNHEYYSGVIGWIAELRRLGLRVLLNEHVVLRHGASSLVVAGVTDHGAHHYAEHHRSDPVAALAGAPHEAAVRILLAHQPRSAAGAEPAGFHLQLSGHTHGGQFWPWNLFVRLQQPFTAGLHRWRALWVYTSRGTGYWGPPKRFGAPSEITRLRLVPARGEA
jgi:predicted MPP superfamily phosphohydrolase